MVWYQNPKYAMWLALAANIVFIVISVSIPIVTGADDPWKLGGTVEGMLATIGNYVIMWLNNTGMIVVKAKDIVKTDGAGEHAVIVPTVGR